MTAPMTEMTATPKATLKAKTNGKAKVKTNPADKAKREAAELHAAFLALGRALIALDDSGSHFGDLCNDVDDELRDMAANYARALARAETHN